MSLDKKTKLAFEVLCAAETEFKEAKRILRIAERGANVALVRDARAWRDYTEARMLTARAVARETRDAQLAAIAILARLKDGTVSERDRAIGVRPVEAAALDRGEYPRNGQTPPEMFPTGHRASYFFSLARDAHAIGDTVALRDNIEHALSAVRDALGVPIGADIDGALADSEIALVRAAEGNA